MSGYVPKHARPIRLGKSDAERIALSSPSAYERYRPRRRSLQSRIVEILDKPRGGRVIGEGYVLCTEPTSLEGGRFVVHGKTVKVHVFGAGTVERFWPEQVRERGRR